MDSKEKKRLEAAKKAATAKVEENKKLAAERKQRKPGVIAAIIDVINTKGPITKAGILEELTTRFPDRKPESMKKTINCQVPSFINQRQPFRVKKNDNNEWTIDGEVPKREPEEKPETTKGTKKKVVKGKGKKKK